MTEEREEGSTPDQRDQLRAEMFQETLVSLMNDQGELNAASARKAAGFLQSYNRQMSRGGKSVTELLVFMRGEMGIVDQAAQVHVIMEHGDKESRAVAAEFIRHLKGLTADDLLRKMRLMIKLVKAEAKASADHGVEDESESVSGDAEVSERGSLFDQQEEEHYG